MTLRELITTYDGNGFFLLDAGNGSAYSEPGFIFFDEGAEREYGDTAMREMEGKDYSSSEAPVEVEYISDWITKGEGDNPYRVRLYF